MRPFDTPARRHAATIAALVRMPVLLDLTHSPKIPRECTAAGGQWRELSCASSISTVYYIL